MPGVFLSYRRDDSAGLARSIYLSLCRRFGATHVFLDVEAPEAGARLPLKIRRTVASADVVVVLVGRQWLAVSDETSAPRLASPQDYVYQEITTALDLEIPVVVVLLDEMRALNHDDLPPRLAPLAALESCRIRHESFTHDVDRLTERLLTYTRPRRLRSWLHRAARPLGDAGSLAAGVAAVVLMTALAVHVVSVRPRDSELALLRSEQAAAEQNMHVTRHQGLLRLDGRVEDEDGRPIPNATISVRNMHTDLSHVERSRSNGQYSVDLTKIEARPYEHVIEVEVDAQAQGFSRHDDLFTLTEAQTRVYRLQRLQTP